MWPTDAHVEAALAEGAEHAVAMRAFVREAIAARRSDLTPASLHLTRLAARSAIDESEGPPGGEDPGALRVARAFGLDRALGRLRRAGARAEDLRSAGSPRANELAATLAHVDASLHRAGAFDPRGAGALLSALLRRDEPEHDLPGPVVVRGQAAWDADDLAWLEALHARLAREGGGVTVVLPRLEGGDEADVGEVADALERRWASMPDPPEIAWEPPRSDGAPADEIVEARGAEAEARAAVASVLAALDAGTPPERIAIVVPDLDEARIAPLRGAFEEAGVPFTEPRGRPALSSPEARAPLSLLGLAEGPVTRGALLSVLRAPGLHAGSWVERSHEVEASRRAAQLAARLRDLPVASDERGAVFVQALAERCSREEAWMPRALERLLAAIDFLREGNTRDEAFRRLSVILDRLELGRPSVREIAHALRAEERGGDRCRLLEAVGEGTAALRLVREAATALRDAARALGMSGAPTTPAEIRAEIERALDGARTARGAPARAGAVRIARAAELCDLSHDLVVVTGLGARAYGGDESDADGALDEATTALLPAPCRPPSARERAAWRRAELAWALTGARRSILTRTIPIDEAQAEPPHPRLAAAAARGAVVRREPASRVASAASILGPRSANLVALAAGARPADARLAARISIELERSRFFLDPRVAAGPHTGAALSSKDDVARAHLVACVGGDAPDRTIGVTHLERAAGCAFAGFARRVLRIRRAEDAAEAADPRERGNLIHRALCAAFEAVRELAPSAPRRTALAAAREAALSAVGENRPVPLRREAISHAVDDAVRAVAFALDEGSPMRFAFGERRFGPGEAEPWGALALGERSEPAPGGRQHANEPGEPVLWVDGQIDRVDLGPDGAARVVDYKTGAPREPTGLPLQLALYADAVERALAARGQVAPRVTAEYVVLRSGRPIERKVAAAARGREDPEAWRAARADARGLARRAAFALSNGEIAPRPMTPSSCSRCEARDVCRRPAVMPHDDGEDR